MLPEDSSPQTLNDQHDFIEDYDEKWTIIHLIKCKFDKISFNFELWESGMISWTRYLGSHNGSPLSKDLCVLSLRFCSYYVEICNKLIFELYFIYKLQHDNKTWNRDLEPCLTYNPFSYWCFFLLDKVLNTQNCHMTADGIYSHEQWRTLKISE